MTKKIYYAHTPQKDEENKNWHSLEAHLSSVAKITKENLKNWHEEEGYLAGLLHDLGKYGDLFQRRLEGKEKGLDHSSQGTGLALKYESLAAAWAIQGHHVGLQRLEEIKKCHDLEKLNQTHPR